MSFFIFCIRDAIMKCASCGLLSRAFLAGVQFILEWMPACRQAGPIKVLGHDRHVKYYFETLVDFPAWFGRGAGTGVIEGET
jgi:hypothetical protein